MSDQARKIAELLGSSIRSLKIYAAQQKESGDTFTEKGLITIANDLQRLDDYLRPTVTAPREVIEKYAKLIMERSRNGFGDFYDSFPTITESHATEILTLFASEITDELL